MKKTTHYCDICSKQREKTQLDRLSELDICSICQILIINKVIEKKLLNLKPWCKTCKSTGKIRECCGGDYYGRNDYSELPCKECKI